MVGQLKRRDLQDSRLPSEDGVSFDTMCGGKGLEFRAVAIREAIVPVRMLRL